MSARLVNTRTGQVLVGELEVAATPAARSRGLLGRSGLPRDAGLWIRPCAVLGFASIHMFGMRFAIDVLYLDRRLRVVKIVRGLKPWRLSAAWPAHSVVELPAGALDEADVRPGDVLQVQGDPP